MLALLGISRKESWFANKFVSVTGGKSYPTNAFAISLGTIFSAFSHTRHNMFELPVLE
jgi:hypothetical protein